MNEISLFPLSTVLLPCGRIPLQIFEQRYLDLVAHCMREGEGFGVVWLRQGSEVSGGSLNTPHLGDYGTYATIVDWDQLPNGLLGITIEGQQRFDVSSIWRDTSGLVKATVTFREQPPKIPFDSVEKNLRDLLMSLLQHPHIQRLQLETDLLDSWRVATQLTQLLPIEESIKYELLGLNSVKLLVEELDVVLSKIRGD